LILYKNSVEGNSLGGIYYELWQELYHLAFQPMKNQGSFSVENVNKHLY